MEQQGLRNMIPSLPILYSVVGRMIAMIADT